MKLMQKCEPNKQISYTLGYNTALRLPFHFLTMTKSLNNLFPQNCGALITCSHPTSLHQELINLSQKWMANLKIVVSNNFKSTFPFFLHYWEGILVSYYCFENDLNHTSTFAHMLWKILQPSKLSDLI